MKIFLLLRRLPYLYIIYSTLISVSSHLHCVITSRIKSDQGRESFKRMENSRENHNQAKFPKLKIFQFVQTKFATVGINRALATQKYPFNGKNIIGFLTLMAAFASSVLYAIYTADSFFEYTQATYAITTTIMVICLLLILILQVKTLFELIEDLESVVNTSEYRHRITYFRIYALIIK